MIKRSRLIASKWGRRSGRSDGEALIDSREHLVKAGEHDQLVGAGSMSVEIVTGEGAMGASVNQHEPIPAATPRNHPFLWADPSAWASHP